MANRKVLALRKVFVAFGYGSDVSEYSADTVVGTLKELAVKAEITSSTANVRGNTIDKVLNWIADNKGSEVKEPYDLTETKTHTTVTYKKNGKTVTAGADLLYNGDKLKVTATPDEGYEITTLTANGDDIESGDTLTVDGEGIAIVATATLKTFDLGRTATDCTVAVTKGGTPVSDGEDVLSYGDVITITATASDGYTMSELKVNGEDFVSGETLTVDDLAQSGEYYQIPTVSFTGLDYGTYKVQLTVKAVGERKTYYLDGIRVYNPLSEETQTDTVVENAYGDEINASFMEIRDILITPESEETEETEETEVKTLSGAVFIDYNPSIKHDEKTAEIAKYKAYGPKNEVYLQNGQAIAFRIVGADNLHLAVGLKSPTGNPVTVESSFGGTKQSKTIRHTADMYYGVTPDENGFIIITNTSGAMLAVTKLKMSGEPIEVEGYSLAEFTADEVVNAANRFTTLSLYEEPEQDNNAGDVIIDIPAEEPVVTPAENWVTTLIKNIKKLFGR